MESPKGPKAPETLKESTEHYEADTRVELESLDKSIELMNVLIARKFKEESTSIIDDYYIERAERDGSAGGGFDTKRYREQANDITYTEEQWEDHNGVMVRKEIRRPATKTQLARAIADYRKNLLLVSHSCITFMGTHEGRPMRVDLDSIQLDGEKGKRYFVEAEILTDNKGEVAELKGLVDAFLKEVLVVEELKTSRSLHVQVYEALHRNDPKPESEQ